MNERWENGKAYKTTNRPPINPWFAGMGTKKRTLFIGGPGDMESFLTWPGKFCRSRIGGKLNNNSRKA